MDRSTLPSLPRVYVAGPMSGLPGFNYPAFHEAAQSLRSLGFTVENPADNPVPPCGTWEGYMRMAIAQVIRSDWIFMLPGWESSRGAVIEHRLASDLGMSVVYADAESSVAKPDKAPSLGGLPPPVDRNAQTLTNGSPVTPDHRELQANGMQKAYVVLSEAERAKGFVRPVRRSYRHLTCGVVTTMGVALAETYARDPWFYTGTFCCGCREHFNVGEDGEFVWAGTDEKVGT